MVLTPRSRHATTVGSRFDREITRPNNVRLNKGALNNYSILADVVPLGGVVGLEPLLKLS